MALIKSQILIATTVLQQGGVLAYPTESVWGLGCDPWNTVAVERILQIKKRSRSKGLIIVACNALQITPLLQELTAAQQQQITGVTPHPVTWLVPDKKHWVPEIVRGAHTSVAIRISQHPLVQSLCSHFGHPIVSTSANLSGEPELTKYSQVTSTFGKQVDMVVPGETGGIQSPSTIIDLITGAICRP